MAIRLVVRCALCRVLIPALPEAAGHHEHPDAPGPVCDDCYDALCDAELPE